MTGAGLALIAGGLATLISFRSILFGGEVGGEERGARRRPAREAEAPEPARPARRAPVAASRQPEVSDEDDEDDDDEDGDDRGGLASIGFSDDEDPESLVEEAAEDARPDPAPPRPDRYGDRIEGWVRPQYQDPPSEPRPGEYWTPIPVDLAGDPEPSAKGYGWPRPVERLPAVPDYEPATGFDLIPIAEPTELMPTWMVNDDHPGRVRPPRSWPARNERRSEKPEPRRRPRPRPCPEQPIDPSTVYVSRHAAEPSPRRD
jgi:hypothetical protein